MKILITGAAGFLGSHLSDFFLRRNDNDIILAIDNVSNNRLSNIKHLLGNNRFVFFNDTILNDGLIKYLVKECDTAYHLAAAVGVENILKDVLNVININIKGTEVVFKYANEYKKRVLFASTSEIYGKSQKVPFKEDDDRILGTTSIERWTYSSTKAIGEYLAMGYFKEGMPMSIVRFFNAYGSRLDIESGGRVISRFIKQILNNEPLTIVNSGEQTRSFTYVDDIIEGIVLAGEKQVALGQIFNIGAEEEISINELAFKIAKIMEKKTVVKQIKSEDFYGAGFEDIKRRVPDITKARQILGYKTKVSLDEGLKRTINWFIANVKDRVSETVYPAPLL